MHIGVQGTSQGALGVLKNQSLAAQMQGEQAALLGKRTQVRHFVLRHVRVAYPVRGRRPCNQLENIDVRTAIRCAAGDASVEHQTEAAARIADNDLSEIWVKGRNELVPLGGRDPYVHVPTVDPRADNPSEDWPG